MKSPDATGYQYKLNLCLRRAEFLSLIPQVLREDEWTGKFLMQTQCLHVIADSELWPGSPDFGVSYFSPIFLLLVPLDPSTEALVQLLLPCCLPFVKDVCVEQLQDQEELLLSVLWMSCCSQMVCTGSPGAPQFLLPLCQCCAANPVPVDCAWKPRKAPSPPLSGLTLPNMVRYVCKSSVVLLGCKGKLTSKRNKIGELLASW